MSAIKQAKAGRSPSDLNSSPVIDNWFLVWRDGDAIRADGDLSGHPEISGPRVTPSPVLGFQYDFDLEAGWLHISKRSPRGLLQCRRASLIVLRGLDIETKPESEIISGTVWI